MPSKMNLHHQGGQELTVKAQSMTSSFHRSKRKAPGTRYGVLLDWREGSNRNDKSSGRHGHAIRDGRQ
jgi:hypothetical protein